MFRGSGLVVDSRGTTLCTDGQFSIALVFQNLAVCKSLVVVHNYPLVFHGFYGRAFIHLKVLVASFKQKYLLPTKETILLNLFSFNINNQIKNVWAKGDNK